MERLVSNEDGSVDIELDEIEADAIRSVAAQIIEKLDEPPEAEIRRLFPPAYPDEVALQDQFSGLTHDALLQQKKDAAREVVGSVDAGKRKRGLWKGRLDRSTVIHWVTAINDARLILGTRLDVSEEMDHTPLPPDDPDAPAFNMYLYLGGLQELLVHHLLEHDLED